MCLVVQIASKVELHVGTQIGEAVSWKRLGSFSFDSNERSKLQSRELKSVTVSVQALFLRIVLARCHVNSQNIYKQVGLAAAKLDASAVQQAAFSQERPALQNLCGDASCTAYAPLLVILEAAQLVSAGGNLGGEHQWQPPE